MPEGTIILDFDSTLISCESLEQILNFSIGERHDVMNQIKGITKQGMTGEIDFAESLSRRLKLASPSIRDIGLFTDFAQELLTPGMKLFVAKLHEHGLDVHIVSGGIFEAIIPFAELLGIHPDRVNAVRLCWSRDGHFSGIDDNDPFSKSKVSGVKAISSNWPRPVVAIGDGMTDYALFEHKLADHFIAFTQHVRRESVVKRALLVAQNMEELQAITERIYGAAIFK